MTPHAITRVMRPTPLDTTVIADELVCCTEPLDATAQRLQLALFRLLAEGQPIEPTQMADRTGVPAADVVERLGRWHGVQSDEHGRVVAFQGLSVVAAPHRLRIGGVQLYAWCAWDTLFLPELIDRSAYVESVCPTSGQTISLRVEAEGPTGVSPGEAVLSFAHPGASFGHDVITSFCRFVHFFASPRAAETWTADHPGTFPISIEEGFEIGRGTNAARWGEAL
jgi:alkylmercury lyase